MGQLSVILTDLRTLTVETLRVWWRLLPLLLALQGASWALYELTLWVAAWISPFNAWVALVVFSLGFVTTLGSIVLMLRLIGRELGVRLLIPTPEGSDAGSAARGEPDIARLLAVTLLPFLGIYAAFNYVAERADHFNTVSLLQTTIFSDSTLLGQLDPTRSTRATVTVAAIVVGTYLLRRGLDLLHERTDWRWLGIVVALVESFFILTVILSAQRLFARFTSWVRNREVIGWFDAVGERISAVAALVRLNLPAIVDAVGGFLAHVVVPTLIDVLAQPIAWLAVAALVFGTHVLSLAELWRKGRPLTAEIPVPKRLARVRRRKAGSSGLRRVALELQEAFLGDIDDKYLPTFQSIRLILRAGLSFLGSYVLLYTAIRLLEEGFGYATNVLSGGRTVDFWIQYGSLDNLAQQLLTEPLRISLLGVAFYRCLRVFRAGAVTGPLSPATPLSPTTPVRVTHP